MENENTIPEIASEYLDLENRVELQEGSGEAVRKIIFDGEKIGVVALKDHGEFYSVAFITIQEKLRGKGIGETVYKKIVSSLNKPLRSDMQLSDSGEKLWEKFVAKGLAKRIGEIPNGKSLYEWIS